MRKRGTVPTAVWLSSIPWAGDRDHACRLPMANATGETPRIQACGGDLSVISKLSSLPTCQLPGPMLQASDLPRPNEFNIVNCGENQGGEL